jgi:hypothetical protein
VGCERTRECARRHESKKCKLECARQMVRDGTRRGAYYVSLVERKEKKEQKDVPRSTKESRDSRGRAVEPWLCRLH